VLQPALRALQGLAVRLRCHECGKSVSTDVADDTIVRAVLICPECLERADRPSLERALESIRQRLRDE
jgi:NAD-dependent SIR2 family protein deacetylase